MIDREILLWLKVRALESRLGYQTLINKILSEAAFAESHVEQSLKNPKYFEPRKINVFPGAEANGSQETSPSGDQEAGTPRSSANSQDDGHAVSVSQAKLIDHSLEYFSNSFCERLTGLFKQVLAELDPVHQQRDHVSEHPPVKQAAPRRMKALKFKRFGIDDQRAHSELKNQVRRKTKVARAKKKATSQKSLHAVKTRKAKSQRSTISGFSR